MKNMTVSEFDKALRAGLGRCVQFFEYCENRELYREAVLQACLNGYAYDEQSEGTRAWYTYKLLSYFGDDEFFFSRTQHKLREVLCWKGNNWDFEHLFDLVLEFARHEYAPAAKFIGEIYRELLDCLAEKTPDDGIDWELSWLEHLCIECMQAGGVDAVVKIASDLGVLFKRNAEYNADSFVGFVYLADHYFGKDNVTAALNAAAATDDNIAFYMQSVAKNLKPIPILTDEEKERMAKKRAGREDDWERDINKILSDIKRYDNTDRDGDWHSVALDIVNNEATVFPIEAYMYVYNGLCACCRHDAVEAMRRHGLLTDGIIRECLYDCYDETRELAEKIIKN